MDMQGFTEELRDENEETEKQNLENTRRQITFGMDMEIFMRSDVGRLLTARAAAEIKELRKQFDDVDPTDSKRITELQIAIAVRKQWHEWIRTAIDEGRAAQETAIDRNVI